MVNKGKHLLLGFLGLVYSAGSLALDFQILEYLGTTGSGDNAKAKYLLKVTVSGADVLPQDQHKVCKGYPGATGSCSLQIRGFSCKSGSFQWIKLTPWEDRAGTKPVDYLNRNAGTYIETLETCGNPEHHYFGRIDLNMQLFTLSPTYQNFILASTYGEGIPIPPITPPIEPLSCKIETVSGGFDFGTKSVHDLVGAEDDLSVGIRCTGGGEGTSSGKLTLKSASGSNKVEMKNSTGDVIPVRLIANKETGSNTLTFEAKDGYFMGHLLWAKVLPFSISTYGDFKGEAIMTVDVD